MSSRRVTNEGQQGGEEQQCEADERHHAAVSDPVDNPGGPCHRVPQAHHGWSHHCIKILIWDGFTLQVWNQGFVSDISEVVSSKLRAKDEEANVYF